MPNHPAPKAKGLNNAALGNGQTTYANQAMGYVPPAFDLVGGGFGNPYTFGGGVASPTPPPPPPGTGGGGTGTDGLPPGPMLGGEAPPSDDPKWVGYNMGESATKTSAAPAPAPAGANPLQQYQDQLAGLMSPFDAALFGQALQAQLAQLSKQEAATQNASQRQFANAGLAGSGFQAQDITGIGGQFGDLRQQAVLGNAMSIADARNQWVQQTAGLIGQQAGIGQMGIGNEQWDKSFGLQEDAAALEEKKYLADTAQSWADNTWANFDNAKNSGFVEMPQHEEAYIYLLQTLQGQIASGLKSPEQATQEFNQAVGYYHQ